MIDSISGNGQITYDQTRFASLSSRLPGTVWSVAKNVGDRVQAGTVVARIDPVLPAEWGVRASPPGSSCRAASMM